MYDPNEALFSSAIRRKIFSDSKMMSEALKEGVTFLYSKKYPTQVIKIDDRRYIRINDIDIEEDTISKLLSTMLGLDYYTQETMEEKLKESVSRNKILDNLDLSEYVATELPIVPQEDKLMIDRMLDDESPYPKEQEEQQNALNEDLLNEDRQDLNEEAKKCKTIVQEIGSGETIRVEETVDRTNMDIEQELKEVDSYSNKSKFHGTSDVLSVEELLATKKTAKQLIKAFKGSRGKDKRAAPAKRVSVKDVALDRDSVYVTKSKQRIGKYIKLNLLVDCSGSMGGDPIKNAVKIVYMFNEIAKTGNLDMNVIYSKTGSNHVIKLPVSNSEILALNHASSSEGLATTIHKHIDILQNVNLICITDGDLVDEPISKSFWDKHRIVSTGVYVLNQEDITSYTGSLDKWFNHSLVRRNVDDLVQTMIRIGLK